MDSSRTLNSTRGAPKARSRKPPSTGVSRPSVLAGVRDQIAVAASAAAICSAVLVAQAADADHDAALVLQRCVGDTLSAQVAILDRLITGGAP